MSLKSESDKPRTGQRSTGRWRVSRALDLDGGRDSAKLHVGHEYAQRPRSVMGGIQYNGVWVVGCQARILEGLELAIPVVQS